MLSWKLRASSWRCAGQFRQFDHGVRYNSLRYGQSQPPAYNLTNAVAPLLFFYSTGDYLAHAKVSHERPAAKVTSLCPVTSHLRAPI